MDQIVGAAARLPDNERKDLAILALARSATITDLAIGRGVSRKFVYAQTQKARVALDDAFLPATGADDVLFELAVTKTWLRQVIDHRSGNRARGEPQVCVRADAEGSCRVG